MTREILEVHDTSALDAITKEREAISRSKLLIASGIGGLLFGLGGAALLWGWSKVREPKIITTEKLVVQEKVVTVDKPIVTEKIVTIDKPVVTERVERVEVPAPQQQPMPQQPTEIKPVPITPTYTPSPNIGDRTTEKDFKNSEGYQTTQIRGRIVSHTNGVLLFDNGQKFYDITANGQVNTTVNNSRHNGDTGYCNANGQTLPNGMAGYNCYALHNGVVESSYTTNPTAMRQAPRQSSDFDPLADLFN